MSNQRSAEAAGIEYHCAGMRSRWVWGFQREGPGKRRGGKKLMEIFMCLNSVKGKINQRRADGSVLHRNSTSKGQNQKIQAIIDSEESKMLIKRWVNYRGRQSLS